VRKAYLDISDVIAEDLWLVRVEENVRYFVGAELLFTFAGFLTAAFFSGFVKALEDKISEILKERFLDFFNKALRMKPEKQKENVSELVGQVLGILEDIPEDKIQEAIEEGQKKIYEVLVRHNFPEDKAKDRAQRIVKALLVAYLSGV
jgi:hypothetical protein